MDAGRYFIPLLQIMTKINIPDKWNRNTEIQLNNGDQQRPREVGNKPKTTTEKNFQRIL